MGVNKPGTGRAELKQMLVGLNKSFLNSIWALHGPDFLGPGRSNPDSFLLLEIIIILMINLNN